MLKLPDFRSWLAGYENAIAELGAWLEKTRKS